VPSSLIVDITPLKRDPDTPFPIVLDDVAVDDLALVSAEVRATRLSIDVSLEATLDQVILSGPIVVAWSGPCRRCLEEQAGVTTIDVHEIFELRPVEGETYELGEDDINLEPLVRETVLLNLPVAPLCSEDCKGPDPDRFPAGVESDVAEDGGDGSDAAPAGDPRWAALDALKFDE